MYLLTQSFTPALCHRSVLYTDLHHSYTAPGLGSCSTKPATGPFSLLQQVMVSDAQLCYGASVAMPSPKHWLATTEGAVMLYLQALQHKLALEANRVGELEGLLSGMRTNQFKSTFSEQHSADKAGSLQARNTLLTQQASWLCPAITTASGHHPAKCGMLRRCESLC